MPEVIAELSSASPGKLVETSALVRESAQRPHFSASSAYLLRPLR